MKICLGRKVRLWTGVILSLICGPGAAEPVTKDTSVVARGHTVGLAGSERLRMFAWGKWLETGLAPRDTVDAMRYTLVRNGYYHNGGVPEVVWVDAIAAPILSFETNINGGISQDSFVSNGFLFEVDPSYRAISGIVLGVSGNAEARLAWKVGHTIQAVAVGAFGWAPGTDLSVSRRSFQLCSRNNITRWIFFDACVVDANSERDLGVSNFGQANLSFSSIFQTSAAYHKIGGTIATARSDYYDQTSLSIAVDSVWDQAVTGLSLTFAQPVAGKTVLDRRVAIDVRWWAGAHAVGLGLWHTASRGGMFLGLEQIDQTTGVQLSWQPRSGRTLEVEYAHTVSSASLYNNNTVTVQLQFDDFNF